jgi:hypothetical protein
MVGLTLPKHIMWATDCRGCLLEIDVRLQLSYLLESLCTTIWFLGEKRFCLALIAKI